MSWSRRSMLLMLGAATTAALAGCGFKPLYEQESAGNIVSQFSQISIVQPEDRSSQQLRNYLLDVLTPRGEPDRPLYRLEYRLEDTVGSAIVTRDEEVLRNNIHISAVYYLRDYTSGQILLRQSVTSQGAFNVTAADYANLVSEKNARERVLREISEQIRLRLGNYFGQKQRQSAK